MKYRTKPGDMLDAICHDYYGPRTGAVELVLNANPGLARLGPIMPENTVIELPPLPTRQEKTVVLWE